MNMMACGTSAAGEPPPRTPKAAPPAPAPPLALQSELEVEQKFGSIDERAVDRMFLTLQNKIEECYAQGRERVSYLAGDAKVFLRIDRSGNVRYAYFEESTLGDRESEQCILDVFARAEWPKPQGGEAKVHHGFGWGPGDERAPASWKSEKVISALDGAASIRKRVDACKAGVKGSFNVTAYVIPNANGNVAASGGEFQTLGIGASTKEAAQKADCIVDALKDLKLPSPGSYAAKVSFVL